MSHTTIFLLSCSLVGACALDVGHESSEIVGGDDTTIQENPWQVSMQTTSGFHFCGGSVLSSEWVLSAQHCVEGSAPSSMRIAAGMTRLSQTSSGQIRNIAEIVTFPGYTDPSAGDDVALLRLASPLDVSGSAVRPIGLVTPALGHVDTGVTAPGVLATVTGWGTLSSGGSSPDILQTVDVPIVTQAQANAAYQPEGYPITSDQIGAGDLNVGGVDSCQGDSGGPLTVPDGADGVKLAGVVSWGFGCADPDYPGMYARVSSFSSWIADITSSTSVTALTQGNLSASQGAFNFYTVSVPAGAISLTVTTSGGSGDADLYVRYGSQPTTSLYDCRPYLSGNAEACSFSNPAAGTWHIGIHAYTSYSGASLVASYRVAGTPPPGPEVCDNGADDDGDGAADCDDSDCAAAPACSGPQPVTFTDGPVTLAKNQFRHYAAFPVVAGTQLTAAMDRLNQNPDLYVRWGAQPTTSSWSCRPFLSGSPGDETCNLTVPAGVTQAFVSVRGRGNSNNRYNLQVTYTAP